MPFFIIFEVPKSFGVETQEPEFFEKVDSFGLGIEFTSVGFSRVNNLAAYLALQISMNITPCAAKFSLGELFKMCDRGYGVRCATPATIQPVPRALGRNVQIH